MGISLLSNVFGGFGARKRARQAQDQANAYNAKLKALENSRQEIINPYENTKDLSGMITNPFANLQVSTKAAEFAASE